MDAALESTLAQEEQRLRAEEVRLEQRVRRTAEELSGLRDIEDVLSLAATRLALCLNLMKRRGIEDREKQISDAALSALRLVDGLVSANVSEDQRGIIQETPRFREVKALLEQFVLAGGGGFLEAAPADARKRRILSRVITAAIRRHAAADDRSPPLLLDDYPPFVASLLRFLFPVMVRDNPQMPPYGIEEGEEVIHRSEKLKLPLSQAILYIESEMIPEIERRLVEDPGSPALQQRLAELRERAEDYRRLRFFPRSTPVLLEKGYYTEGMTSYTVDGEMLVTLPIPVTMKSGTNLDRRMELVRMDVVRRIAGKKVSAEVDREYARLRSLESGPRGSSRTPSMKLDTAWGYRALRQEFPFLARLADKERFAELVDIVMSQNPGSAERRIASLIERDQQGIPWRPSALLGDL